MRKTSICVSIQKPRDNRASSHLTRERERNIEDRHRGEWRQDVAHGTVDSSENRGGPIPCGASAIFASL